MKKLKICFVTINCSPDYLGGYALYHKNLIKYIKKDNKNIKISWVYFGNENKKYFKEEVQYFKIKTNKLKSFLQLGRHLQLTKFFKKNDFDIINAGPGPWAFFYKKKKNQKIIQTLHGTVYYFNKNHFKRFNLIKKIILSPLLLISWIQGMPSEKADKFIYVSEKIKRQVEKLYGKRENAIVIRTGVDLNNFEPRNKVEMKKELKLDENKTYGLFVGGGGYWTKGLDRTVKLCKEIYKLNKNFRLIVIGPDYKKVKHLINEKFIIFLQEIPREKMPLYYSASDIFFCMSRYEGGAPTLVVSEAMASSCLIVCSRDSKQEIIKDEKNGVIISSFENKSAKRIINLYNNKKLKGNIIKNSMKTIKEISLEKWGEKTLRTLLK